MTTPIETNLHGDALCFVVRTWARHKTMETVLNNGWQLTVEGWRLAVGGGWWSLGAVLNEIKIGVRKAGPDLVRRPPKNLSEKNTRATWSKASTKRKQGRKKGHAKGAPGQLLNRRDTTWRGQPHPAGMGTTTAETEKQASAGQRGPQGRATNEGWAREQLQLKFADFAIEFGLTNQDGCLSPKVRELQG